MRRKTTTGILFFLIILVAFVLRMSLLGVVPPGLTNDEADIGYDAYSLLTTGKDQWGQVLPLTSFKGFGDYRLPLYTYLVVPVIAVFDLNAASVRIPSAIFGVISVALIYFLAKKLFQKQAYPQIAAFAAMFFMAVSPWAVGLSRLGIESNVAITFFILGILCFLHISKGTKYLFLSFIFFSITLYAYTSYTFLAPVSIIILWFFYRKDLSHVRKPFILGALLFILLITPLFVIKSASGVRVSQVSFINSTSSVGILSNLDERRGSCNAVVPSQICKLFENKPVVFTQTFISNYLNHFSASFLYINGTTTQFSILPFRSLFYVFELVFLLSGLIGFLRLRFKSGLVVITLLLVAVIPDAITGDGHYSRASSMMLFMFLIEGFGVGYLWLALASFKKIRLSVAAVLVCLVVYFASSFVLSYFTYFPEYYSTYGQFGYEPLTKKMVDASKKYEEVYLSKVSNDTKQYIYYLFYTKYPPQKFQDKTGVYFTDDNGWVSIDRLENIHYVDRLPTEVSILKMKSNVMFITHPSELPKDYVFFDVVRNKKGDVQFGMTDSRSLLEYYTQHSSQDKQL